MVAHCTSLYLSPLQVNGPLRIAAGVFGHRAWHLPGQLSYSAYLLNFVGLYWVLKYSDVGKHHMGASTKLELLTLLAAVFAVMYASAWLMNVVVERPVVKLAAWIFDEGRAKRSSRGQQVGQGTLFSNICKG